MLYRFRFKTNFTWGTTGNCTGAFIIFDINYVNDLHKCSNVLDFHFLADDTDIFLQDQNLHSLEFKLNEELDKVNQWLQLNRLSLNIDKTK